jgi:hypothetical protein
MLFEFFAYLTGLLVLAFVVVAWLMYRDSFHPVIYIGPMLLFLYSFLPLYLASRNARTCASISAMMT